MEALLSSETSVTIYQRTRRHITEDLNSQHRCLLFLLLILLLLLLLLLCIFFLLLLLLRHLLRLLLERRNSVWVLACWVIRLHLFLLFACLYQRLIFITFKSCFTSPFQLILGFLLRLKAMDFHAVIFLFSRFTVILYTGWRKIVYLLWYFVHVGAKSHIYYDAVYSLAQNCVFTVIL